MLLKKTNGDIDQHKIMIYTLSNCRWCQKTLSLLNENRVEYKRVNVDPSDQLGYMKVVNHLRERKAPEIFPTTIIDGQTIITGHKPDQLSQALGLLK